MSRLAGDDAELMLGPSGLFGFSDHIGPAVLHAGRFDRVAGDAGSIPLPG